MSKDSKSPRHALLREAWIDRDVLDEFYMKRVGAMRTRAYAGRSAAQIEQFHAHMEGLRAVLFPMLEQQAACFERLRPQLAARGLRLAAWAELDDAQRAEASDYFDHHVSPALTPLSLDPSDPLPFMSNLSTSWGFVLRDPELADSVIMRVKVPSNLPQWIALRTGVAAGERCFVALQDVVRQNAQRSSTRPCSGSRATPTSRSRKTPTTASRSWSRSRCASAASSRWCASSSASHRARRSATG